MAKKNSTHKESQDKPASKPRKRLSQGDVPGVSLDQALRVPRAIIENYGSDPVTPLDVASALEMSPSSGPFKTLCGASIAYGLTTGGYNAGNIELQDLARRILTPEEEGDDDDARREALLRPRIMREFLEKYDRNALPQRHDIALNVLASMGVPRERAESAYTMILDGANSVGFIRDIKGKQYIDLSGTKTSTASANESATDGESARPETEEEATNPEAIQDNPPTATKRQHTNETNRRVFITHGKNRDFVDPIKKLLAFGEMSAVVSVEKQSVSKPVPEKVMDDMRSCSAAIIHVADEQRLLDQEATEHVVINSNVLIEVGAAMALFGRRFILLVKDGVKLPSNLQGLYEVRYEGDALDGNATIRLLEAINDIKNNPMPDRYRKSGEPSE